VTEERNLLGVLASGRGSNMLAIADACAEGIVPARIAVVISDQSGAPALDAASRRGIPAVAIDRKKSASRTEHDGKMAAVLEERNVRLVCLAGYMRLLSPEFIRRFGGRIMNIHPALLPSFPGLHPQRQAVEYGVRVSGVTVHFVDEGCDTGPVILQKTVEVRDDDTEETLSERILDEEHRVYPEAIRLYFQNRLRIEGRRVRITGR
jgi:phosphoribosylglycinamide formyltransferase-1